MDAELVFYTHPMSRGRIVRWMLEEVGQPYRTEILDYASTMKGDAYLAINPMGKVPALRHGGTIVTEAAAICAYLAETFRDAGLAPTDAERGAYFRWLFFAAGPLEAAATNRALGLAIPEGRERMLSYGRYEDAIGAIEAALTGTPYIAGDRFTAADVYVGAQLGWSMQFGTIEKRPAFLAYWERVKDRPAALRARAIDDALLPAKDGARG